jgi:hypothetical protein
MPDVISISKRMGVAGQYGLDCRVQYPDEPARTVTFVGSVYGGPVVMVSGAVETFVDDPDRFGEFGPDWARRFFGATVED